MSRSGIQAILQSFEGVAYYLGRRLEVVVRCVSKRHLATGWTSTNLTDHFQLTQDLEEERVEFVRNALWSYVNAVSLICVKDDEVSLIVAPCLRR